MFRRGDRALVAINFSDEETTVGSVHGLLRIATDRSRDDLRIEGELQLGPWEAAVVWLDQAFGAGAEANPAATGSAPLPS